MKPQLPKAVAEWVGVAGFFLASLALILQYVSYRADRAKLDVSEEAQFTGFIDGGLSDATITTAVKVEPVLPPSPHAEFKLTVVVVNRGRRPIRLISATVTYLNRSGRMHSVMRPLNELLTEERRRAVITVAADSAVIDMQPAFLALLDELGECHQSTLLTSETLKLAPQMKAAGKRLYCIDPALQ